MPRCRSQGWPNPEKYEAASVIHANNYSMEVRSDHFESAKSHFFDTSSWGPFCDVTLTLKQARQSDGGRWIRIDDYPCRQAFRHRQLSFEGSRNSGSVDSFSSVRSRTISDGTSSGG